jgi:diguanylate cyclase (GGDEF)-like protein/PAS domain S-box-containing protein
LDLEIILQEININEGKTSNTVEYNYRLFSEGLYMEMYKNFTYFIAALMVFLLILICILLRNIYLRTKAEKELREKNEEITAVYEEIAAADEELRTNMQLLMEKQEELQRSEQRYRLVMESTADIIWEGDLITNKRIFSEKLFDILGYKADEMQVLDAWFDIVHPDDVGWVKKGIQKQVKEKVEIEAFEYRVKSKDGTYKWVRSNTKCEFNEDGAAVAVFGAFTDISELKEQQERVRNLAYYDSVTGLPNRVMLREAVMAEIERCHKNGNKFALFFIDLDNFKFVNDTYGHMTGDRLLLEVTKRLKEIQAGNVMASRLGGDEFIVLMKDILEEQVEIYAKSVQKTLAEPIFINNNMFRITHSSGIALYPDNGLSFDDLLKNADTAMYKSKELGKGTYTFYDNSMGHNAIEKFKIQADLHRALENNEFMLYYQPIIGVNQGEIKGFEALIRWNHPKEGIVFPDKFIGVAEENGTIIPIGKWVISNACKYAKSIYDSGLDNFYVSVNVSAIQLMQGDFTDFLLSTLNNIGLPPEFFQIEITESVLMESMDLVIEKLKELKNNNIKIALDDFGCGYSSLKYLKLLPINIVKIDKSFIDDIKSEDDAKGMARSIILLAKQLGLSVIGEGVETKEQLGYLKRHGSDMFQGYLVSKPVPEVEANNLLKQSV